MAEETRQEKKARGERTLARAVLLLQREGFTTEQLNEILRDREETWSQVAWNYRWNQGRIRWWKTTRMIEDAIIAFAKDTGRWPERRQFLNANGLPSPNTMEWHFLHNYEGRYKYGNNNGKDIWERMVDRAEELPPHLILSIPNLTRRREAIEKVGGYEGMIKLGGGQQIQQDDYGTLWRIDARHEPHPDHWAHFVEVVNSTQKVDENLQPVFHADTGDPVYDHYFLRVPPNIFKAKDAVAWTGHFEAVPVWRQWLRADGTRETISMDMSNFEGFLAQS